VAIRPPAARLDHTGQGATGTGCLPYSPYASNLLRRLFRRV